MMPAPSPVHRLPLRRALAAAATASALAGLAGCSALVAGPAASTVTVTVTATGTSASAAQVTPMATPTTAQISPPDLMDNRAGIIANAATAQPDAIVLDVHIDYQCPVCGQYEAFFGSAFDQLAQDGSVLFRYHIRSFLDSNLSNNSSTLAGIAATCADTVGAFQAYHDTIFANQGTEAVGVEMYSDTQLRDEFAAQAGITGDKLASFQACYDQRATWAVVKDMETIARAEGVNATPTFLIGSAKVDLTQTTNTPEAVLATLRQVAGTA